VAALAGVTRITVSRYLREPNKVAPETAEKIRDAVASVGYVPNMHAGNLSSGRSKVVAALIPGINQSVFADTVQGLSDGLAGTGFELLLTTTGYDVHREEAQLRALIGWAPAAVVVTGRDHTPATLRLLADAQNSGTPVVAIWDDRQPEGASIEFACIGFQHEAVGRAMARRLLQRGHRHLGFIQSHALSDSRAEERAAAFADELMRSGANITLLRAGPGDQLEAGRQAVAALLAPTNPPITAAAFANDNLACGALLECTANGIPVPERISLLGFGDLPIGRQLSPDLSTVKLPRVEIGTAAAQSLLQALRNDRAPQGAVLPWEILERRSTR
jgi:LacI family gluconate utilization system Gnt-I transcriptional repressor